MRHPSIVQLLMAIAAGLAVAAGNPNCLAQTSPSIQPVATAGELASESARSATFHYRPANVGQQMWQHVTLFSQTIITYKQSGQVISRRQVNLTREQIRRVTVLETGRTKNRVQVTYDKAQETRNEPGRDVESVPQVVADKSYHVARLHEGLQVSDLQGHEVSKAEAAIVMQNMQAVGRPNALAEFLNGRTLIVGKTECLPEPTVEQLLGWQDTFGAVESVTLTLERVKRQAEQTIAECQLEITCAAVPELAGRTSMKGKIELETDTCRPQATTLAAELAAREQRGPEDHPFFVTHEGQANVHSQARLLR